ncbi:MAG: ROK family protein [bacterium]
MQKQEYVLGLDIGGTKIAAGLVDLRGRLAARMEVPTEQEKGFHHSFSRMKEALEAILAHPLLQDGSVSGIGACAPGPLDPAEGILFNPPNLLGWKDFRIRESLESMTGLPVHVDNDANAAGLAEAIWGAAAGYADVFYATVSTGVGTAIIRNRSIVHGKNGVAGEGGHVTINFSDQAFVCNCGNIGCIEAYASGIHVARRARDRLKKLPGMPRLIAEATGGQIENLTMEHLDLAARQGDAFSQEIIQQTGTYLGIWLGGIVSLLDPDVIVIGGGLTRIGEPLFQTIRVEMPRRTINRFAASTPIVPAALDRDVGIYGAAALCLGGCP